MDYSIKTTHYSIVPDTKKYLDEKMQSLEKYLEGAETIAIELSRTTETQMHGRIWRAECTLQNDGRTVRAVALEETLHAAIDAMKDEIASQLKKTNAKKTSLVRRAGAKVKHWLRFGYDA